MASMNDKDYYAILGVGSDASADDIRKAFQTKARKLHPDVNKAPGAEERFKEVSEAYAVLSDPDKRRRYDAMRSGNPFAGPSAAPSPAGAYGQGGPFDWGFPFGAAGGGPARRARGYNPQAGGDVVFQLDLDVDSAREGCARGVTYQRYASCDACSGKGSIHSDHARTCPTCGGSGHISVDVGFLFGMGMMSMVCPECEGSGRVVVDPCERCGGTGRVLSASEVVVRVPAGSHDGDVVRLKGMGNAGTNGAAAGDFVCRVGVPSERLTPSQGQGMQMIGFALPFVALGLIMGVLAQLAIIVVVPLVMGVALVLRGGTGLRHGARWWKNAGSALLSGAINGASVAVFVVLLVSCMSGLGTAGYRGGTAA